MANRKSSLRTRLRGRKTIQSVIKIVEFDQGRAGIACFGEDENGVIPRNEAEANCGLKRVCRREALDIDDGIASRDIVVITVDQVSLHIAYFKHGITEWYCYPAVRKIGPDRP